MNGSIPIISLRDIKKSYGKRNEIKAVDGLSLDVYPGETFGLLGPNGSGKTTTIRILNGIIKPTSGNATVNGFDVLKNVDEIKRSTGLLAETAGTYEKLSPTEYLEFIGSLYDVSRDILPGRIAGLLDLFNLVDRKNDLIEGFSKGMRQKLLIAAALIHDPPIIFLDEPTSALDPRSALVVKDLIKDLSQKANKTVFVSSHILPLMEEVCDRIAIINQGKLVALGTVEQIVAQTGTANLEAAFIALTGGEDRPELLAWRNVVAPA